MPGGYPPYRPLSPTPQAAPAASAGATILYQPTSRSPTSACTQPVAMPMRRAPGGPRWGCDVGCTGNWRRRRRLACYLTPCTLEWRLSCDLASQGCQPLAMPLGLCNLLKTNPLKKVMPPGTEFAFS